METAIELKRLARAELSSVAEIERTEGIAIIDEEDGTDLVKRRGTWDSPAWNPDGTRGNSVAAHRQALEGDVDAGGIALGAFSKGQLVGIGVMVPDIRLAVSSSVSPCQRGVARNRHWPSVC